MFEYLFFAFGWVVAFGLGFRTHKQFAIDYKARWKQALALVDAEKTATAELTSVTEKPTGQLNLTRGDIETRKKLKTLRDSERERAEEDRLNAGLYPIDSLDDLWDSTYRQMVKRRLRFGYDESGRKFK